MRSTGRTLFLLVTVFAALSLVLAACGNGDDDGGGDDTGDETEATQPADTGGEATEPADGGGGDLAAAGEEIYQSECAQCHSTDGSEGVGPTWQGVWGSEVELESGETVTVDEEYVTNSIQNPDDQIVAGFSSGIMPTVDLSDEEINQIIAYMKTLS